MAMDALNAARRKLNEALGEKSSKYFGHMKQWFRMKLTKEEFDTEARALLSAEQARHHNEFLLALLNKVEGLAETSASVAHERAVAHGRSSRRHRRQARAADKSSFEPADLLEYLPPSSPPGAGSDGVKYASQEIFLPDHALVVGRSMLAAWEAGLEGAEDEAADLVVVAVQHLLKNIITAVITQRKAYKVRGHMTFDAGCSAGNMWSRGGGGGGARDPQAAGRVAVAVGEGEGPHALAPAAPPTLDEVEHAAALEMACSAPNPEPNNDKITLEEFYNTLLTHRNVIANHSVYAVNMERVAAMLNHPSY